MKNDKLPQLHNNKFSNIGDNSNTFLKSVFNQPQLFGNHQRFQLFTTPNSISQPINRVPDIPDTPLSVNQNLNSPQFTASESLPLIPVIQKDFTKRMSEDEQDLNRLRHNEIIALLHKNSQEIENLRKEKSSSEQNTQIILNELRKYQNIISEMMLKQNTLETKLEQLSVTKVETKIVTTAEKETMTDVMEAPQIVRTRPAVVSERPPRFVSSPSSENVFSPSRSAPIKNTNKDMKHLFDKYEVKGTITTKRSVDFSVSTLNYLQRYGLIDENKI